MGWQNTAFLPIGFFIKYVFLFQIIICKKILSRQFELAEIDQKPVGKSARRWACPRLWCRAGKARTTSQLGMAKKNKRHLQRITASA